jgi:hypothetical protein
VCTRRRLHWQRTLNKLFTFDGCKDLNERGVQWRNMCFMITEMFPKQFLLTHLEIVVSFVIAVSLGRATLFWEPLWLFVSGKIRRIMAQCACLLYSNVALHGFFLPFITFYLVGRITLSTRFFFPHPIYKGF